MNLYKKAVIHFDLLNSSAWIRWAHTEKKKQQPKTDVMNWNHCKTKYQYNFIYVYVYMGTTRNVQPDSHQDTISNQNRIHVNYGLKIEIKSLSLYWHSYVWKQSMLMVC